MNRRTFLQTGLASAASLGLAPSLQMTHAEAAPSVNMPYGAIDDRIPDSNGLLLPEGFSSQIVASAGELVEGTGYPWHLFPSGAATFPDVDGGWYLVSNSDVSNYLTPDETWGGASSIHFDKSGTVVDAYSILTGSHSNAGGAPTPWGTWLSCEADFFGAGRIWECDPTGAKSPILQEGMGLRNHGGAAVDPDGKAIYLTEDHQFGRFYRYRPNSWPDLSTGVLEIMVLKTDKSVLWEKVDDPMNTTQPARQQNPEGFSTPRGKGCWYHDGKVIFSIQLNYMGIIVTRRNLN